MARKKKEARVYWAEDAAGLWIIVITNHRRLNFRPYPEGKTETEQLKNDLAKYDGQLPGEQ